MRSARLSIRIVRLGELEVQDLVLLFAIISNYLGNVTLDRCSKEGYLAR